MYQKDLPPKELTARLDAAVEDAVATVGVDANRASAPLGRVAGLNKKTAAALRARRDVGRARSRDAARRRGDRAEAFANVAGFLRIGGGAAAAEPLDATRIHPESYADARRLPPPPPSATLSSARSPPAAAASTAAQGAVARRRRRAADGRRRRAARRAAVRPSARRRPSRAPRRRRRCARARHVLSDVARARRSSTPSSRTSRSAASSTSASAPTGCCTRRSSARTAARSRWRRACASSSSRSTSSAGGRARAGAGVSVEAVLLHVLSSAFSPTSNVTVPGLSMRREVERVAEPLRWGSGDSEAEDSPETVSTRRRELNESGDAPSGDGASGGNSCPPSRDELRRLRCSGVSVSDDLRSGCANHPDRLGLSQRTPSRVRYHRKARSAAMKTSVGIRRSMYTVHGSPWKRSAGQPMYSADGQEEEDLSLRCRETLRLTN